jgi:type I restriction enzyme S subunit
MNFVPLGKIAEIQLGKMLSPSAKTGKGSRPYLRNLNVQWGRFELSDLATMDFSEREREKFTLRNRDLLVCEGGEPGRCAVWDGQVRDCYFQKALHRVRPDENLADSDFLSFWIWLQALTGTFADQNAKTTIAHLPLVRLERLPIPDVGIQTQRQLAASFKAQLAELETVQQVARKQWHDAAILRSRLLKDIFRVLGDSTKKMLGDWAATTRGSTPSRGDKRYWQPAEIPWVKTGEVGFASITATEEAISKVALAECSLTLLPAKTVLIAMYGQGKTRGQSAILEIPATTNQACFAILPNETWEPEFLFYWLIASYQDLRDMSEDRGGNQANLNGSMLKALEVPAPDRTEQLRIVQRIKAALTEMDLLQAASQSMLEDIDRLPQRILAQAFGN